MQPFSSGMSVNRPECPTCRTCGQYQCTESDPAATFGFVHRSSIQHDMEHYMASTGRHKGLTISSFIVRAVEQNALAPSKARTTDLAEQPQALGVTVRSGTELYGRHCTLQRSHCLHCSVRAVEPDALASSVSNESRIWLSAGWWCWADACTSSDGKVAFLPNYLPGIVATGALIMINAVRRYLPNPISLEAL